MNHYDPVPWRHQHREVSVVRGTSPITVTHLTGVKFSIDIRGHEVLVDQTINGGGTDSAPTPVELLGAAWGAASHSTFTISFMRADFLRTASRCP
jgi:hypothetical protein